MVLPSVRPRLADFLAYRVGSIFKDQDQCRRHFARRYLDRLFADVAGNKAGGPHADAAKVGHAEIIERGVSVPGRSRECDLPSLDRPEADRLPATVLLLVPIS
jgi:hypothetical protein